MTDADCTAFLRWALPRLGLRWTGFRYLRGQVCKRLRRRLAQLGLPDLDAYRARLEADPSEWQHLDNLCVVTISRFYRDRSTWDALRDDVLPSLAEAAENAHERTLRCWSIGCASGEEPFTLSIVWGLALAASHPSLRLRVLATDIDEQVLERARRASYEDGSLRELPVPWRDRAFEPIAGEFVLRDQLREPVELRHEDFRDVLPVETFRLILCRNVVLTYIDDSRQRDVLARILTRLAPGGAFVVGRREREITDLPLVPWAARGIYRHEPDSTTYGSAAPSAASST